MFTKTSTNSPLIKPCFLSGHWFAKIPILYCVDRSQLSWAIWWLKCSCHVCMCVVPNERILHLLANCGACGLGRGAGWWPQHPTQLLGAIPNPTVHHPIQPPRVLNNQHTKPRAVRTSPLNPKAPAATNSTLLQQLIQRNKSRVCFLGTLQMLRANMQAELTGRSVKTKVSP